MYKITILILTGLMFNACASNGGNIHKKSKMFLEGKKDGCTTAKGTYSKQSHHFKTNTDYEKGWFIGRRDCR